MHESSPDRDPRSNGEPGPRGVLAYWALQDPRDLADVLHLAAAFCMEVHLIGRSLEQDHPKVVQRLRSWRPDLAQDPSSRGALRFPDAPSWIRHIRLRGLRVAATVVEGGERPPTRAVSSKLAVLFGEETYGLSGELLRAADERWSFPLGPGGRFFTVGQTTALVLGAVFT